MNYLINKFEKFGKQNSFIKPNARILIGLSGGSDSIALTLLLKELQPKYALFLIAAHVNYHLRGEESNADEKYVKEFCSKQNIPLYILHANIKSENSIQNEARLIRLDYFKKLKKNYKIEFIALGHQFDDQTETILHRFIRGSGFTGLRGILPNINGIIHPLLIFKKESLIEYLKKNNIKYCTDKTNFKNNYTRNKIRNDLIPTIKNEYNPNFEQKLVEYIHLFSQADDYFSQAAKKVFKKTLLQKSTYEVIFDVITLRKSHPIIIFYVVREAWSLLTQTDKDFYFVHFQDILFIIESEDGYKEIILPKNIVAMKTYNEIIFRNLEMVEIEEKEELKELDSVRHVFSFNEYRITMQKLKNNLETNNLSSLQQEDKTYEVFDLDKIIFPIVLRYRQPGDRFIPFGMSSLKKIKYFFIDEKVPLKERDNIVLFCDTEKIFWVGGYRIDQRVAVTSETKNVLTIKIEIIDENKKRKLQIK